MVIIHKISVCILCNVDCGTYDVLSQIGREKVKKQKESGTGPEACAAIWRERDQPR